MLTNSIIRSSCSPSSRYYRWLKPSYWNLRSRWLPRLSWVQGKHHEDSCRCPGNMLKSGPPICILPSWDTLTRYPHLWQDHPTKDKDPERTTLFPEFLPVGKSFIFSKHYMFTLLWMKHWSHLVSPVIETTCEDPCAFQAITRTQEHHVHPHKGSKRHQKSLLSICVHKLVLIMVPPSEDDPSAKDITHKLVQEDKNYPSPGCGDPRCPPRLENCAEELLMPDDAFALPCNMQNSYNGKPPHLLSLHMNDSREHRRNGNVGVSLLILDRTFKFWKL